MLKAIPQGSTTPPQFIGVSVKHGAEDVTIPLIMSVPSQQLYPSYWIEDISALISKHVIKVPFATSVYFYVESPVASPNLTCTSYLKYAEGFVQPLGTGQTGQNIESRMIDGVQQYAGLLTGIMLGPAGEILMTLSNPDGNAGNLFVIIN